LGGCGYFLGEHSLKPGNPPPRDGGRPHVKRLGISVRTLIPGVVWALFDPQNKGTTGTLEWT